MTAATSQVESAETIGGGVCRVTGIARPSAASEVRFELRLPASARWSGRYYQLGNGGFAGSIAAPLLAEQAARGDAVAASDTGHRGDAFDASWAAGHPERVTDYGWRSIGATSDAARVLVARYYGRPAARHYAIGCSNGGRMALMAAARWPQDWDGVIAGAPATPWTAQFRDFARLQTQLRATPASWIAPERLPAIQEAALAGCPKGSVIEGIARDPAKCRIDFARLKLTIPQRRSLEAIVRAGYLPAAMQPADWARWIVNPDPNAPSQLSFARQAHHLLGADAAATLDVDPRALARFGAGGGKILSYFGWSDAVISPVRGVDFYRSVQAASRGAARTRGSYRLFMVPGMTHCQGGDGADGLGQSPDAPPLTEHPAHDVRRALEAWVEQGRTPDTLVAAKWRDGRLVATQMLRPQ